MTKVAASQPIDNELALHILPLVTLSAFDFGLFERLMLQNRTTNGSDKSPLAADVFRRLGRTGTGALCRLFLLDRAFRPLVTLRLYHATQRRSFKRLANPILAVLHKGLCQLAAIDLPLTTNVAPGLAIIHGWGLVLTEGASIGRNVTLFHGATVGQGDKIEPDGTRTTGYPILEDGVWVGPGVVIVGAVQVGAGSRILANSVLVADVPPRSLVGGNPARILRTDCEPDIVNPVA